MQDIAIIQSYLQSSEKFPVPFEEYWQWVGYSRKDVAKRVLEANFTQDADYSTLRRKVERQWVDEISLSNDCAKNFAMLAQTDTGKQVRNYFLECEKALHQVIASKPMDTLDIMAMAVQQMREQREELKAIAEKQESFEADRAEANAYLEERQNEPVQTLFVTTRRALDDLIKSYAVSTGADVQTVYTLLYKEFSLRYGINVYRNAKKQNLSGMSWIEANGYIAQVYEIAKDLFNSKAILAKKGGQNAQ
jgi:phage anti-repressor protein